MSLRFHRVVLPAVIFLLLGGIALFIWQKQNDYERSLLLRHTESAAEQIRLRIEGLMSARIASLKLLAERWVERRPLDFSRERFLRFAETCYDHYPGFTGINWVDPDGVVRWVFPEQINAVVRDKRVYEHPDPRYRASFEKAAKTHRYEATPSLNIYQGGMGFDAFIPLSHEGEIQGYLDGVFQVEKVMDICLAEHLYDTFLVRILDEGRLVFSRGGSSEGLQALEGFPVPRQIHFPGKTWELELKPSAVSTTGNVPVLVFGLTLSAALSMVLYFLLQRIDLLRETRDKALSEVRERQRVEEALRENENKREALLAELSAKNAELEAFVYTVSHDLKTPIVTIEGFVGALKEDFSEALSDQSKEYLRFMSDAAHKMELLINDLLDLSRVGRLTEHKTRFPFGEVVEEALATLQPIIEERHIDVTVGEDLPMVYGERKRLVQVLDNLLGNAAKYMATDNPAPRIEIGATEQNSQKVFFVRDNGIGIDGRFFDKVFEIFQRLPAAKKLDDGTGIGLTIVKRIVEHHGGRIWLASEPGKGSTFFFTLEDREDLT